jgi:hypothetical protein
LGIWVPKETPRGTGGGKGQEISQGEDQEEAL